MDFASIGENLVSYLTLAALIGALGGILPTSIIKRMRASGVAASHAAATSAMLSIAILVAAILASLAFVSLAGGRIALSGTMGASGNGEWFRIVMVIVLVLIFAPVIAAISTLMAIEIQGRLGGCLVGLGCSICGGFVFGGLMGCLMASIAGAALGAVFADKWGAHTALGQEQYRNVDGAQESFRQWEQRQHDTDPRVAMIQQSDDEFFESLGIGGDAKT